MDLIPINTCCRCSECQQLETAAFVDRIGQIGLPRPVYHHTLVALNTKYNPVTPILYLESAVEQPRFRHVMLYSRQRCTPPPPSCHTPIQPHPHRRPLIRISPCLLQGSTVSRRALIQQSIPMPRYYDATVAALWLRPCCNPAPCTLQIVWLDLHSSTRIGAWRLRP